MASESTSTAHPARVPLWMASNFAQGAAFFAFISLLVPPFVTEVTGQAAAAGVVMAVISLAAVLGPVLGGFADRYDAHRLVLVGGVVGMAVSFAAFAISADQTELYALDAIAMGVSLAAVNAVAPLYVVGLGYPTDVEARQMTVFQIMGPAGQVVGGVLVAAMAKAGWTYGSRFWAAAAFIAVCAAVTWLSTAGVSAQLRENLARKAALQSTGRDSPKASLRQVFLSAFGIYLLVLTLSSVASNGVNNQIANIFPEVFGIDAAATSGLIALAGVLNIAMFFLAGRWMARAGVFDPLVAGIVGRGVGCLGLALVGVLSANVAILVIAFMQLLYQASPFVRIAQPGNAVRFAQFGAGSATGWLIAASAMGSFIGSALGGLLADSLGYTSILWMAVGASIASIVVLAVGLVPAKRKLDAAASAPAVGG